MLKSEIRSCKKFIKPFKGRTAMGEKHIRTKKIIIQRKYLRKNRVTKTPRFERKQEEEQSKQCHGLFQLIALLKYYSRFF